MGLVELTTCTKQRIVSHLNVSCSTTQGHNAAPTVRLEPANPSIWSQALPDLVVYSSGTVLIFSYQERHQVFEYIVAFPHRESPCSRNRIWSALP